MSSSSVFSALMIHGSKQLVEQYGSVVSGRKMTLLQLWQRSADFSGGIANARKISGLLQLYIRGVNKSRVRAASVNGSIHA